MGGPRVLAFLGNPRELKNWLVSIRKGQLITEGPVSKFILDHLAKDPQTWTELEGLLIGKYVDEGMAVEEMRSLMKLAQIKGESPSE